MNDEELIAQWHSLNSAADIGRQFSVPPRHVMREWRRLKACGLLPPGDRPRRDDEKYRTRGENVIDGRPSVGNDDPLLAKLSRGDGHKDAGES
jgi:hypothetical protein